MRLSHIFQQERYRKNNKEKVKGIKRKSYEKKQRRSCLLCHSHEKHIKLTTIYRNGESIRVCERCKGELA